MCKCVKKPCASILVYGKGTEEYETGAYSLNDAAVLKWNNRVSPFNHPLTETEVNYEGLKGMLTIETLLSQQLLLAGAVL